MSEETARQKRELESSAEIPTEEPETKKLRTESAGVDLAKVKRQIEYYFSDDNLKFDQFFNPIIAADPEHWLPIGNILSCKRIQNLGATAEDVVAALCDSHLEVKEFDGSYKIRRTTPPPTLESRPERPARENRFEKGKVIRSPSELHAAGVIVKLEGIPAEASWEVLKTNLAAKLPSPPAPPPGPDGKERRAFSAIQFISRPENGSAIALLQPFENDINRLTQGEVTTFEADGAEIKVAVLNDLSEASAFITRLPALIKKKRDREIIRKKREISNTPIELGGQTFQSADHLRRCLKEVLSELPPGKIVNAKTAAVLKDLLSFHPNGAAKLKDFQEFKVDAQTFPGSPSTKCFFVVRSDGSTEDFSVQKCFALLTKNPPLKSAGDASKENQP